MAELFIFNLIKMLVCVRVFVSGC